MTSKLALKQLTASDLTLFEWQFRHLDVGGQKSINLNANVFVDQLFPAIGEATRGTGRIPSRLMDIWSRKSKVNKFAKENNKRRNVQELEVGRRIYRKSDR